MERSNYKRTILYGKQKSLENGFIGETMECQMIQVFSQIENKQNFLIQFQMIRKKNFDIFLKAPMLDKNRREGEEE